MPGGRYSLWAASMALAGGCACLLTLKLSAYGFSGYDVSPMIDAGWRIYTGQIPGQDFVVTFPASLYLLTALSFHLFGVTWRSTALGACSVYGVVLLLGLRLGASVRQTRGEPTAVFTAAAFFVAQTIPLISINYLWHASLAESFGVYAVYAAFVFLGAGERAREARAEACLHLAFACGLLLLSKPNTAYPAVALCMAVVLCAGMSRVRAALLFGASAALAAWALATVHVTPWRMLSAYFGLTGRMLPKAFVNGILYALYPRYGMANLLVYALLAPPVFAALSLAWKDRRSLRAHPDLLLGAGAILVSILGMGTNFDFKLTDSPLAILGLSLLAASSAPYRGALRGRSTVAAASLLLLAIYFGRTRFRMEMVGSWADDKCGAHVTFRDPFFGRLVACPVVPEALAEVDRTLGFNSARKDAKSGPGKVFFGPSLEFLYAARSLSSPAHLPNWWDPGSSYPLRKQAAIEQAWKDDDFDLVIMDKDEDRQQLAPGIQEALASHYILVPGTTWTHVYRRR